MQFIFDLIKNIRWQDYLDIIILSVIIYRILLMLRGTRTIQILSGFLVVAIFFYFADIFNLIGSTWVLTNIMNSIVIVFIVLFQSDIKNALAQMGTTTLFHDAHLGKSSGILDSIYSVCEHFSKMRTGALIVLENEMGLGDYYSGATKLNAEFSRQLLVSIFNPHSPLHDGAVVINRDGLIAYAGCILPLSKEIDIAKNQGTRHRAALGLSEESDAVVLTVSEETGEISLAYNGELITQSTDFKIRLKIKEIFAKTKKTTEV
ncbi:MAG: TIGR00159 family protein [SAR324 cluster bacterium]|nr:TIGR00159 family protein [SAR324 cluster bacterium]